MGLPSKWESPFTPLAPSLEKIMSLLGDTSTISVDTIVIEFSVLCSADNNLIDTQVEIRCMGQLIVPTLQLSNLVDLWLQMTSSDRVPARIGTSAKEFVMVLVYGRRVPAS